MSEKKGMSDKLPSDQLGVLEEHWGNELEEEKKRNEQK